VHGIRTGKSTECHHVVDAADDDDPNDPAIDSEAGMVGVCRDCHRYISARRSSARGNAARAELLRAQDTEPNPEIPFTSYSELSRWL
jgi:hypothetical protein